MPRTMTHLSPAATSQRMLAVAKVRMKRGDVGRGNEEGSLLVHCGPTVMVAMKKKKMGATTTTMMRRKVKAEAAGGGGEK